MIPYAVICIFWREGTEEGWPVGGRHDPLRKRAVCGDVNNLSPNNDEFAPGTISTVSVHTGDRAYGQKGMRASLRSPRRELLLLYWKNGDEAGTSGNTGVGE